ncbi:MAG: hypothetical protein SOI62_05755, partial [Lactobacillus sp.]
HVLGTPPAFVLSQDQTLILKMSLFNLLQIIACELTSLICLDSSKLEPAHCETLFSFQSTNLLLAFRRRNVLYLSKMMNFCQHLFKILFPLESASAFPREQIILYLHFTF